MKTLVERPRPTRLPTTVMAAGQDVSREPKAGYAIGLLVALGIHAAILFGWARHQPSFEQLEFAIESADASVEVALVAALPGETPPEEPAEPETAPPPEPETVPPPPEPVVEPPPVPEPLAEMTIPKPEPKPAPKPATLPRVEAPKVPKAAQKPPVRLARAVGDGSAAAPGRDTTTAAAASGALSANPGYLRNPHPAYPEAARKASQEGVVQLQVQVDERGQVSAVSIARSSGFPLLDERALRTVREQWSFKAARLGGVAVASRVVIPIRFTLRR